MFIALCNLSDSRPKSVSVAIPRMRRLKNIMVLDTEDGVVEKVSFSLAVQYCDNLEAVSQDKMWYNDVQRFECRSLDLAYFPLGKTSALYHKGYMYYLPCRVTLLDVEGGEVRFTESIYGRVCVVKYGDVLHARGGVLYQGDCCSFESVVRTVSMRALL